MAVADIYLLGSGIHSSLHFSVETLQAISVCRTVFVLHDDLSIHEYLKEYCSDVRDLAPMYENQEIRSDVYHKIAELLVKEALDKPKIAFIVHGHPLFLVSAAEYTLSLARSRGLRVSVLPAVSSFDTILCDLEIDYGYGLQMFDATTLIREQWKPNPAIPMLVFQLATTLNGNVVFSDPDSSVLKPLVNHLLETYSPEHNCIVLHSSSHIIERSTQVEVELVNLSKPNSIELWKRPTLYVPPIS